MKKSVLVIVILSVILSVSVPAKADLLYFPKSQNEFYLAHRGECIEENNTYIATVDTFYYDEPQGTETGVIREGESVRIYYIWPDKWEKNKTLELDDNTLEPDDITWWGLDDFIWGGQWICLKDFKHLYRETDFIQDHRTELVDAEGIIFLKEKKPEFMWGQLPESGDPSIKEIAETIDEANYPLILWEFPGSGSLCSTIPGSYYVEDFNFDYIVFFNSLYLDSESRLWGKVDNFFFSDDGWICLSAMSDDTLPRTAPLYAE